MKLISLILIILQFSLNLKFIQSGKLCSQSWECGNDPFTVCQSKFNIFPGIGVDPVEGKVYVIGRFNSTGVMYGNVTIASIPINGDGILKSEFTIKSDVFVGSTLRNTTKLAKYLPKSKLFLIHTNEILSHMVGIYNDSATINLVSLWYPPRSDLTPNGYNSLGLHFDEINKLTYTCEYDIRVHSRIVKNQDEIYGSGSGSSVILNIGAQCYAISNSFKGINIYNNTIIYATINKDISNKNTTFYIGSADCVICKRPFFHLYTYKEWITGFHIFNNMIYFSSRQGIFQLNVPGADKILVISNDAVDSFEFVDSENTIYYTSGGKIKKINVSTLDTTIIYDSFSNKNIGVCTCANGFTGSKCDQCINGTTQWQEGIPNDKKNPLCVKNNYKGIPESCQSDSQCDDSPFFLCKNNECLCRPEFFGNKCDQCQGTLSWSDGAPDKRIPTCTPTYLF